MAPATTRWPSLYPVTCDPSFSMMPTGSWPTMRPLRTGYSPRRMWTSVPQIVVVLIRSRASSGPTSGTGRDSRTILPGSANIAAFIFGIDGPPHPHEHRGVQSNLQVPREGAFDVNQAACVVHPLDL